MHVVEINVGVIKRDLIMCVIRVASRVRVYMVGLKIMRQLQLEITLLNVNRSLNNSIIPFLILHCYLFTI